jgi:hypothetical protein
LGKVPGPGAYDLKPHFADVPKYLLPGTNWNDSLFPIINNLIRRGVLSFRIIVGWRR